MKKGIVSLVVGLFVLASAGFAHADFVANKDSKVFHNETCSVVKQMKDTNKVTFKTADEATKAGYTACKKCAPVDVSFVGNKSSMTYHKDGCRMAASIKADNVVKFATEDEAVKAGYKACSICFPSEKK